MLSFYDTEFYPMILVGRTGIEVPKEIIKVDSRINKSLKAQSPILKSLKGSSPITKTIKVNSTVIP